MTSDSDWKFCRYCKTVMLNNGAQQSALTLDRGENNCKIIMYHISQTMMMGCNEGVLVRFTTAQPCPEAQKSTSLLARKDISITLNIGHTMHESYAGILQRWSHVMARKNQRFCWKKKIIIIIHETNTGKSRCRRVRNR